MLPLNTLGFWGDGDIIHVPRGNDSGPMNLHHKPKVPQLTSGQLWAHTGTGSASWQSQGPSISVARG